MATEENRANEDDRVIYIQRCETFRHFDTLRWQIPTIALTGGSVLLGLTSKDNLPPWWAFLVFSLLLALSSYAVYRIRDGIRRNNDILIIFADRLGDVGVDVTKPSKFFGASWWNVVLLAILSIASLGTSIALIAK